MSWQTPENLSADEIVDLFTGTPDGTKYLRDDGTLATPSGGGTDASALTTGTLPAARLPGVLANVDTQAELLSAAAAAAASHTHAASDIASGTVATARLGSGTANSSSFLRGDQTWAAPSATDSTKLALDGSNAMTERLQFSGTGSSAGSAVANIWRDSNGDLNYNVATGKVHDFLEAGAVCVSLGVGGVALNQNTQPATSVYGLWGNSGTVGPVLQAPTTGYLYLSANGTSAPLILVSGASASVNAGGTFALGSATSVANGGTKTVKTSASTLSGFAEVVDTTNSRVALYKIEAGVPTKDSGHAQFVTGAPGAGEVGLELSSTTLRINNGSGGALLLGCHLRVF